MATGFNTQTGNGQYRLQFETDNKAHYLLMQETARRCVDGKKGTNADRIRAMSDEELAVGIKKIFIGKSPWCDHHCKLDDENSCSGCLLEWLKRPAEGDPL